MFDDTTASAEWLKIESENNIIAFCRERGEGKSSAMISFINAVYALNSDTESILFFGYLSDVSVVYQETGENDFSDNCKT